MNIRLIVLSILAAGVAVAQQPQPGVTAPPPQQQTEEQQRDEAIQRQQRARQQEQQQRSQGQAEASQQELKVSEEEAKKQVTDANKASELMGMKVVNRQNEDLGKIKDIVVDFESGKVAYVVLSSGTGFFGAGGSLIAVPVAALTPRDGAEGFIMDADKARLEQAQGFDADNWPAIDAAEQKTVGLQPDPEHLNRQQDRNPDRSNVLDNSAPDRARAKDPNRSENR